MNQFLTILLLTITFNLIGFFSTKCQDKNIFLTSGEEIFNRHFDNAGKLYKNDSLPQSLISAFRALEIAQEMCDDELITRSYMRIFQVEYKSNNFKHAIQTARKAIDTAPTNELKYRNFYNLGLAHSQIKQYDSALYLFSSAYEYFVETKDQNHIVRNLNQIGITYYFLQNYPKAREIYFDLLDYSQVSDQEKYVGFALNNIGNAYLKQGLFDSAMIYLDRALVYQPEREKMRTYMNIAKASDYNYGSLLKAMAQYSNSLDKEEYLEILQQLRLSNSHPDSVSKYALMISDLVLEINEDKSTVSAYTNQLEIANIENQIALEKVQRQKHEQIKWFIWTIISVIVGSIVLFLLMTRTFRKKWLPKNAKYKIDLLNYQVKESQRTLKQFMDRE